MPTGRPSSFTQEKADKICAKIEEGFGLSEVCALPDMPATTTVHRWLRDNDSFHLAYARARKIQADTYADETIQIADEATPEDVQVARLRTDARKWRAAKLNPTVYGDATKLEHSGPGGGPIKTVEVRFKDPEPKGDDA